MSRQGRVNVSGGAVVIQVDDRSMSAVEGQSLAGVMQSQGVWSWRRNAPTGELRGAYCGMGVCFECEVTVDDVPHRRACLVHVTNGMRVATARPTMGDATDE